MKLSMTSIPVLDVAKAFDFYSKVLNFDKKLYMPEHYLAIIYKKDEVNGPSILLEPVDNEIYAPFQTKVYAKKLPIITFSTKNIENEYQRLINLGVKFIKPSTKQDLGMEAIFDDTCGNYIQLIQ
ncbi:VOC family protein [Lutibacter sp.]|uniref:VOC family protein n=1 Tax=Lutibacter sp. TaxID=1925666 RepID=UPI002733C4DB|nr:VOC family protein [Lutibacter sp.]MDP3313236.1 VOC family protein [Lutibacter sp.]